MNDAFINSYFLDGSCIFKEGYDQTKPHVNQIGYLDNLSLRDKVGAHELIRNLFVSIFIHNITYIKTTDLFILFKFLGIKRTLRIIQSDCIKLVDDSGLDTGLFVDKENKKHIGFFTISCSASTQPKHKRFESSFDYLTFKIERAALSKEIRSAILYNVEKRTLKLDVNDTISKIKKELNYDFLNRNITDALGIENGNIESIETENINKVIRLAKSNQSLLYSAILNVDNLICEANASSNFRNKFKNLYNINQNESVESFNYLINKFGIPDFTDLILNDILTIEEFLELRQKRGSAKFRDWFYQLEHSREMAIKALISQTPNIKNKNKILTFLRWSFSSAIGVIEPISGTIYSAIDTFILNKLMTGWNPSLYLNESLGNYLNKRTVKSSEEQKQDRKTKYFGTVGRNDQCPCESGKKYKQCCGYD